MIPIRSAIQTCVCFSLLIIALRSAALIAFSNAESLKKRAPRKGETPQPVDNPYRSIISWFDKGNHINSFFGATDKERIHQLYAVDGLHALVKKNFSHANEKEAALLVEFCLFQVQATVMHHQEKHFKAEYLYHL